MITKPDYQAQEQLRLVRAAQEGDRRAFDELVRSTYRFTYTLALRLTGNDEDARDVVQESYLRAYRSIGKFRTDAKFTTWMYRITANCASTHMGKRKKTKCEPLGSAPQIPDVRSGVDPAQSVENGYLRDRLVVALDSLPPKLRSVVVLRDVYGLAHDDIAKELGISATAAKVRLHRARKSLRERLDETPVTEEMSVTPALGHSHAV